VVISTSFFRLIQPYSNKNKLSQYVSRVSFVKEVSPQELCQPLTTQHLRLLNLMISLCGRRKYSGQVCLVSFLTHIAIKSKNIYKYFSSRRCRDHKIVYMYNIFVSLQRLSSCGRLFFLPRLLFRRVKGEMNWKKASRLFTKGETRKLVCPFTKNS